MERFVDWATASFTYDGDGRRVTKTTSAGTTAYVYDPAGNLAAEYGGPNAVTGVYLSGDHLGSTRGVTNASGGVVGCHDYVPFGEEIPGTWGRGSATCYGQADTAVKYTGQLRDSETGFDYFGARYFSGAQGRFTSPDEPLYDQDTRDPQSWNLYAYGRNNPLQYFDPTGRAACKNGKDDNGDPCFDSTVYIPRENAIGAVKSIYNFFAGLFNQVNSAPSTPGALDDPFHGGSYEGLFDRSRPAQLPVATLNNEGQRKGAMVAGVIGMLVGPGEGRIIKVLEEIPGAISIEVTMGKGVYEVMASDMRMEGSRLILERAHIQGTGPGQFGPAMYRELKAAARQFGSERGASEVTVVPGVRLGGANPGHQMAPFTVKVQ